MGAVARAARAWQDDPTNPVAVALLEAAGTVRPDVLTPWLPGFSEAFRAGRRDAFLQRADAAFRRQHPEPDPCVSPTAAWGVVRRAGAGRHRIGGPGPAAPCRCGHPVAHLLTLDPLPPGLGVRSVRRLTLAVCPACMAGDHRHDADGVPVRPGGFGAGAAFFAPRRAALVPGAPAGRGAGRGIGKLGGRPAWVQDPDDVHPCPECGEQQRFLLQVESGLRTAAGGEFLWGDAGRLYGYWCDGCRRSALFAQSY